MLDQLFGYDGEMMRCFELYCKDYKNLQDEDIINICYRDYVNMDG